MEEENSFLKKNLKEIIVFIGFIMYYVSQFYYETMFEFPIRIIQVLKYGGLLLIAFKIVVFNEFNWKEWLLAIIIGVLFAITAYYSSYRVLLEYLVVVLGFKNVNYKKVLILFLCACSVSLLTTIICCKVGLIENVITYRSDGTMRQAVGTKYSTDFAAFFFFLFAAYLCLNSHISNLHIIIITFALCIGIYFLYTVTDARLDCTSIVVAFITALLISIVPFKFFDMVMTKIILKNIFVVCAIGIMAITIFYNPRNEIMKKVDSIITNRLETGQAMYNKYGLKMWGQKIEEHGSGGNQEKRKQFQYEFIDCSYLKIIMKYGITSFVIVSLASVYFTRKLYNRQKYVILMMLIMIFINSTIAHHYLEIIYNFMIPLLLCDYKHKKQIDLEDENEEYEEY